MTWRLHILKSTSKALATYTVTYSLLKNEHLNVNIKLTLRKALIGSMVYACPTWEYVADTHLLKPQLLQNRVLSAVASVDRCTLVCRMHMAYKSSYSYIRELCRKQAELFQNYLIQMYMQLDKNKLCINASEAETWQWSGLQPFS
jgi:hypothetical protein